MSLVPGPAPVLHADPDAVRACGEQLLAASAQVDDLGAFAAGAARVADWHGLAADAYLAGVRRLGRHADARSLAVRAIGLRVLAHADELTMLGRRRDRLEERRRQLDRARASICCPLGDPADLPWLRHQVDRYEDDVRTWRADLGESETSVRSALATTDEPGEVDAAYADRPDPADAALARRPCGGEPIAVRWWWESLSPAERAALLAACPGLIGNLDGVPAAVRAQANAIALARDLAALGLRSQRAVLRPRERDQLLNARAADDALGRLDDGFLYAYDPDAFGSDGAVAVGEGEVDQAEDVAVVVPGFGTDAADAPALAGRIDDLLDAAHAADYHADVAAIGWIGYDAPDGTDSLRVLGEGAATAGGGLLGRAADGLRASRSPTLAPARLTVIGHSYGSTVVGHAAHDHGLPADDVVVLGSPGLGGDVRHAGDLGLDPHHVWVGAASRDPVAQLGDDGLIGGATLFGAGLGRDPAEDDFGAVRFHAESVHRGHAASLADHSRYFEPGSESLANVAAIVTGHGDDVGRAAHVHDPWWDGPHDPEWGHRPR